MVIGMTQTKKHQADGKKAPEKAAASGDAAKGGVDDRQQLVDQLQRLQAEFENYKRRTEKENAELGASATSGLIQKLLPVLDNFELALSNVKEAEKAGEKGGFYKGVELIYAQLIETLETEGLVAILPADGERFDPYRHEAMLAETKKNAEKNTVLEVLQKGYALKGKVLRTAKVKVAK